MCDTGADIDQVFTMATATADIDGNVGQGDGEMNDELEALSIGDDDAKFEQVPVDFPRPTHHGTV